MTDGLVLEAVVDRVTELLLHRIGLRPDPTLRGRVRRAVLDEMAAVGREPVAYYDSVVVGGVGLQGLLNRVTVQETAFFRHPEQFEVLAREVLPMLGRPVRIWSAGCANGQEAYSLAMLLQEQGIDGQVIATDISTTALERTAAARYSTRELSGLSPRRTAGHLTRTSDGWLVNSAIRERVSVLQHNLLAPLPLEVRSCQVIFCRNVLIYLSPESARAFLDRVADAFPAATPLFLGTAETIWQVSDRFKAVSAGDTFIHRQATASDAVVSQRGAPVEAKTAKVEPRIPAPVRPPEREPRMTWSTPAAEPAIHPSGPPPASTPADLLSQAGQDAIAAGNFNAAVVAFRKCAYLAPQDPVAQLHLGLALEAAGDGPSAQRAYSAARQALSTTDPAHRVAGFDGYATVELTGLLDSKQRRVAP